MIPTNTKGLEVIKTYPKLGWNAIDCDELMLQDVVLNKECLIG